MMCSKTDVPVALVFFNRPEQFRKVFETVQRARPSRLFLIQDGPRQGNENDAVNVEKCRQIVEDIDWECEVTTDYSEENLGCGKRIYTGLSKCFEYVDRLIILEDDCVPSPSFFPFCEELLEKYKNDERVGMITGMNHLNTFDKADGDYIFSEVGSIAGWATWRRSWSNVKFQLHETVEDEEAVRLLKNMGKYSVNRGFMIKTAIKKNEEQKAGEKLSSWSTQFSLEQLLNSRLVIAPKVNLMSNIGLTAESANSASSIKMVSRGMRPLYRLKLYEMEFPLKHPKHLVNDVEYGERVNKMMHPNKAVSLMRKVESVFLRVIHGDMKSIIKSLKRRMKRIFKR